MIDDDDNESRFTVKNRQPKEIIKLSGEAITVEGAPSKSKYFEFLTINLDSYTDLEFTPEQALKISNHLRKLSTGATAMVPMFCGGELCPFKDRCPLFAINQHPLGRQCLIETQLVQEFLMRVIEEYDIDPNSYTEIAYANELAEIEILLIRLNMSIARPENAELILDQTVAIGQDGSPVIQKQLSPFLEQKEKLYARRSKIIKLMVGDRQEKYKKEAALKVKLDSDPSSKMANMRARLEELTRQVDNAGKEHAASKQQGFLSPQDLIDGEE